MKNLLIVFMIIGAFQTNAQNVNADISKAKSAYSSENYVEARKSLQEALNKIETEIAEDILDALPLSMAGMTADKSKDVAGANIMSVGLALSRFYGSEEGNNAEINIADDSPMIAIVNTFLSNPLLAGMASMASDQKQITIDGHKGMMQKEEGDDGDYTIMIPFGASMITFETNVQSEADVLSMAQTIPVSKIVEIVK